MVEIWITPKWRGRQRMPGVVEKTGVVRIRNLECRHEEFIQPNVMHRLFIILSAIATHQKMSRGNLDALRQQLRRIELENRYFFHCNRTRSFDFVMSASARALLTLSTHSMKI
jgi:hypothetical protein